MLISSGLAQIPVGYWIHDTETGESTCTEDLTSHHAIHCCDPKSGDYVSTLFDGASCPEYIGEAECGDDTVICDILSLEAAGLSGWSNTVCAECNDIFPETDEEAEKDETGSEWSPTQELCNSKANALEKAEIEPEEFTCSLFDPSGFDGPASHSDLLCCEGGDGDAWDVDVLGHITDWVDANGLDAHSACCVCGGGSTTYLTFPTTADKVDTEDPEESDYDTCDGTGAKDSICKAKCLVDKFKESESISCEFDNSEATYDDYEDVADASYKTSEIGSKKKKKKFWDSFKLSQKNTGEAGSTWYKFQASEDTVCVGCSVTSKNDAAMHFTLFSGPSKTCDICPNSAKKGKKPQNINYDLLQVVGEGSVLECVPVVAEGNYYLKITGEPTCGEFTLDRYNETTAPKEKSESCKKKKKKKKSKTESSSSSTDSDSSFSGPGH